MEPEELGRAWQQGQKLKRQAGTWEIQIIYQDFLLIFLFAMTVVKCWNTVQKGAGITIPGGAQDQTGQSPEESLFWADVG